MFYSHRTQKSLSANCVQRWSSVEVFLSSVSDFYDRIIPAFSAVLSETRVSVIDFYPCLFLTEISPDSRPVLMTLCTVFAILH